MAAERDDGGEVIAFRVYYHDQAPYDGQAWLAPAFGVLAIVERDAEHGRRIVSNGDYYVWDDAEQRWYPMDYIGLVDYLARPGAKRVLFGRLVSDEDYREVWMQANADPDFPPRTAFGRIGSKVR